MNSINNLHLFTSFTSLESDFSPNYESLARLQYAWSNNIPFENIDLFLQRPINLDLNAIAEKLLVRGRGGCCFEQNMLFQNILEQVGFTVTPHLARVVWGAPDTQYPPQTHMLLLIRMNGSVFIVDVGFGGVSQLSPLLLKEGVQNGFILEKYSSEEWLISLDKSEIKRPMYIFTEHPCEHSDILVSSHFVATHDSSIFRHHLIIAGMLKNKQHNMMDLRLVIHDFNKIEHQVCSLSGFCRFLNLFFKNDNVISREDLKLIYDKIIENLN